MKSLLAALDSSDVETEPFPHIVARDVLAREDLQRLIDEFPQLETFPGYTREGNVRLTFPMARALESADVTQFWKEFLVANANREQLVHFARIFGEHFKSYHPRAADLINKADSLKVGLKHRDSFDDHSLLVSAAIDVNTPNQGDATSVRGPHVDSTRKAWFALFYLRDEDESEGGDLGLYRLREGQTLAGNIFNGSHLREEAVECVKTVQYEANTLFIGVNGPHSIHGVSPRHATPHPRKFATFNCDLPERLF